MTRGHSGRHPLGRRLVPALLAVAVVTSGCHVVRRRGPIPAPVELDSPTPFTLHQPAVTDSLPARTCAVLRLEGDVIEVRGDTLRLSRARTLLAPARAERCAEHRAALVVTTDHPDLRARTARFDRGRSIAAVLLILPFLLSALLIYG